MKEASIALALEKSNVSLKTKFVEFNKFDRGDSFEFIN